MKKTQKARIVEELLKNGLVRRNWALSQFPAITRLGAIICQLEEEGWVFDSRYSKDKSDYGYIMKSCPMKKSVYKVGDKEIVRYT